MPNPYNAFCNDPPIRIEGSQRGPLAGLTFAVKDLFDFTGYVTGAGNPDWARTHAPAEANAEAVQKLLDAGASGLGKTHTDELSKGIFGENAHYGTPINPRASSRIPGGSSSGSAVAVAGKLTDFALGTDTGGSVRVPGSFCGIYGIRPSHGRVSVKGVVPQAPSFDTVGWFARDPDLLERIGSVLFDKTNKSPSPDRLVVSTDVFSLVDPATKVALEPAIAKLAEFVGKSEHMQISQKPIEQWLRYQGILQGDEAWSTFGEWIDKNNPRFGFEVADNFLRGTRADSEMIAEARQFRADRRNEFCNHFDSRTVICLPTTPFPAPLAGQRRSQMWALRIPIISLTSIAGMLGAPQLTIPVAEVEGAPVGLSIMALPGSDEMLLSLANSGWASAPKKPR
jgi:amidase